MRNIILFSFLFMQLSLFTACVNKEKGHEENVADTQEIVKPPARGIRMFHDLPPIPNDKFKELENANQMDLIFLNYPVTMNFEDEAVTQIANYISRDKASRIECGEEFYIFFKKDGDVVAHIGVLMGNACNYVQYYDSDAKPVYANKINNEGIKYFYQLLTEIKNKIN